LIDEAIENAIEIQLMGEATRIFDLEYVIAIALDVGRAKDLQRIDTLLETTIRPVNVERLNHLLSWHAPATPRLGEEMLLDRWKKLKETRDGRQ